MASTQSLWYVDDKTDHYLSYGPFPEKKVPKKHCRVVSSNST